MDTPFERLDRELREEWRDNPTTRAFLKTIAEHRQAVIDGLVDTVRSGKEVTKLSAIGGELRALDFYLELATKE